MPRGHSHYRTVVGSPSTGRYAAPRNLYLDTVVWAESTPETVSIGNGHPVKALSVFAKMVGRLDTASGSTGIVSTDIKTTNGSPKPSCHGTGRQVMSARDAILGRLKKGVFSQPMSAVPQVDIPGELPTTDLAARFIEQLIATHAEVRRCDAHTVSQQAINWMADIGSPVSWVSRSSTLGQQLWSQKPHDTQWVDPEAPMGQDRARVFNDIGLAVTGSHSAIFETGTLVLIPDQHEPRTMSLVPPIHLVVVQLSSLVARFEDWILRYPECAQHTNVVLITGPSKTADIQQTLAYGAHGPKRLLVLLVE